MLVRLDAAAPREADPGERIYAWLKTVAIHEAFWLDGKERRPTPLDDDLAELLPDKRGANPDALLDLAEALDAIESLSERQRQILGLLIGGFSYDEITEQTGASYRTIDRQLVRARARIRKRG